VFLVIEKGKPKGEIKPRRKTFLTIQLSRYDCWIVPSHFQRFLGSKEEKKVN
jgi:hypothetical protein